MKSQKLSIYLIKPSLTEHSDIIKDTMTKKEFNHGILYYKNSDSKPPSWVNHFFNTRIENLKNSSASGVYITKIDYDNKNIYFALSFGYGWHLLQDGVIVEQFGLKTVLNIIKDNIKKIEKKNFSRELKDVSEQMSKNGPVADFGFDIEQEIMRGIVGVPENEDLYGKYIIGKDSLSLSVKKNVDEVNDLLNNIYEAYESKKYKKKFDFFDNFSFVKDKKLTSELDEKIIENIRDDKKKDVIYWLVIPEIINWENTKGFQYNNTGDIYQDITFTDFKASLRDKNQEVDINLLKKKKVYQIDTNDDAVKKWFIYECIYAEIDYEKEKYLLVSGKYYKIDKDYKKRVEREFTIDKSFSLPDWRKDIKESEYNEEVAENDPNFQCLDGGVTQKNLIQIGKSKSKVEFADLVSTNKYLIHVKKGTGSSVLSHLFNQGLVSATLLVEDKSESQFRKRISSKLLDSHKSIVPMDGTFNSRDYTIVYAIGILSKDKLKLPFFSLVSYKYVKKQLQAYGYKVIVIKIQIAPPIKP